jgi:hypothetical protein
MITVKRKATSLGGAKRRRKSAELRVGRVPRVARLMAAAIRFDQLIRDGVVVDRAELARLGHVSRARVTQIMNMFDFSSELQGLVLFLSAVEKGKDPITERDLRPISAEPDWKTQRRMWDRLALGS